MSGLSEHPVTEAARLLRQRMEMGAGDVFLEDLTRDEVMALARKARTAATSAGPPVAASPPRGAGSAGAPSPRPDPGPDRVPAAPRPETRSAPARPPLPVDYRALRDEAMGCTRCALAQTRKQVVFSDGVEDARLVVVGEAPGANEDDTGFPFVGAAGQFLDLLLASVDLSRKDSAYICNVLKCRPPGNRNPQPEEIEACSPFLLRQLEIIAPQALLAVGTFSAQLLTGESKTSLGNLRGRVHSYQGIPLVVTYHPAALLRNARWTRSFWDDLQLLRQVMDSA
ncbi:MAG: uracil-DNA glycosylase [Gemmatimonadota bacterium]|nr:uracil-DNA glycosylase [Gemmatimonadota bacterium]MDH5759278.1 uracil-DNA glycosylase [Gemmatimonadota bacterium]